MKKQSVYRLVESALLLAVASVLSVIKLVDMPYGGSITLLSMLPLVILAYRHGVKWGLLTGFTYGLIQLLLGLDNFSYATSFGAAVAILVFDYLLAFVVLGFGGVFRRAVPHQGAALALGSVLTGVLRYLCHVISGATVWYGLSVPSGESLNYSFGYNLYMAPEILLLAVGALYLSRVISFDKTAITRAPAIEKASPVAAGLSAVGIVVLLAATITDIVLIVPSLQSDEAAFTLAGLAAVDWPTVGIVTAVGLALFALLSLIAKKLKK